MVNLWKALLLFIINITTFSCSNELRMVFPKGPAGKSAYEVWVDEVINDSYEITADSEETLDKIATIFKQDTSRRFLITGQTDARGSEAFNQALSEARAGEVVKALEKRDVPHEMMKWRGIGKKIAIASPSDSDNVRCGDRKITVELITNMDYWNQIPRLIVK